MLVSLLQSLNEIWEEALDELPTKEVLVENVRRAIETENTRFIPQHILNQFTAVDALETMWRDKTNLDVRDRLRQVIELLNSQLEDIPIPESRAVSIECHAEGCAQESSFLCMGCCITKYCSTGCQADAWQSHKARCGV